MANFSNCQIRGSTTTQRCPISSENCLRTLWIFLLNIIVVISLRVVLVLALFVPSHVCLTIVLQYKRSLLSCSLQNSQNLPKRTHPWVRVGVCQCRQSTKLLTIIVGYIMFDMFRNIHMHFRYKQMLEEGKIELLKHATGYTNQPMPDRISLPSKHSRWFIIITCRTMKWNLFAFKGNFANTGN